jgi:hypothetical protein
VIEIEGDLAGIVVFFSACMLIAVGLLVRRRGGFPQIGPVFSFIGFSIYIAVLFALSFPHQSGSWSVHLDRFPQVLYFFAFTAGVAGLWAWALWPIAGRRLELNATLQREHLGMLLAFILVFAQALGVIRLVGWSGMAVFNILILYQAIAMIIAGCRDLSLKTTVAGCVLFSAVTLARSTDLFVSLLARSLVFFVAGAALFSVGMYYSKARKHPRREKR